MDTQQARPVYVTFEMRSIEDRNASIAEGHLVYSDVAYAIVTPPGGHLTVEKNADEWLRSKRNDQFYNHYKSCFDRWQSGQEEPVHGMALKNWPPISPSQITTCLAANVRTVEDLATAPDDALRRIGMGARALQQKALAWLNAASNTGAVAEENVTLRRDVDDLKNRLSDALATIAAMQRDYEADEAEPAPKRRGRPPKVREAAE